MEVKAFAVNPVLLYHDHYLYDTLSKRVSRFLEKNSSRAPMRFGTKICSLSRLRRKMYLSQPPVTEVKLVFYGRFRFMPYEDCRGLSKSFEDDAGEIVLENQDGLTAEHVIKAERHASRAEVFCEVGSPWLSRLQLMEGRAVVEIGG